MNELADLAALAAELGVHTGYSDGLGRPVTVSPETLVRVCAALGAPVARPADAGAALRARRAREAENALPPVTVAWDGELSPLAVGGKSVDVELRLESGATLPLDISDGRVRATEALPPGYHSLTVAAGGKVETTTIIAAPQRAWRRRESDRSWGLGTQLAALRSTRSRAVGDLRDLEVFCRWVGSLGGDLVTLLPLLPTFNSEPTEPSPYSPVSRLFWSELVLDLGDKNVHRDHVQSLDVAVADGEVRAALADVAPPDRAGLDAELIRYARFRGAQARYGRNWRDWPEKPRRGILGSEHVDPEEERFQLVAQVAAREQLTRLRRRLEAEGVRLGLDLAVGVHPDGYDPWSRQELFVEGMSVGAPPDPGFPSGQDWGFAPVDPEASRREGHRYLAASIAHQAALAGVLRVDHVMALTRLYWIPHGAGKHEGTYVSYPVDELFAIMTLESHRHRCEIVGENLGTVPPEIDAALPRHAIRGMYLALFEALESEVVSPPGAGDVALIGTHDTPTLAGWIAGVDIDERVRCRLLDAAAAPATRKARAEAAGRLAAAISGSLEEPRALVERLLEWLGASSSPLVIPWLEDLWLEIDQVNLPGTTSAERPNWQRQMRRLLDDIISDPDVEALVGRLHRARNLQPAEN